MKTQTILGVSLAAVFAMAMIVPVTASDSWLGVDDSNIVAKNKNTSTLTITATDDIPKNAGEGVLAGFGWLYANGPDTVFAVTTHNPVRDSHQNPDKWHAHNVVLGGSSDSSLADLCIHNLSGYVQAGISIKDNTMTINAGKNTLSGDLANGALAFHIVNEPTACGETILANGQPSGLNLGVIVQ